MSPTGLVLARKGGKVEQGSCLPNRQTVSLSHAGSSSALTSTYVQSTTGFVCCIRKDYNTFQGSNTCPVRLVLNMCRLKFLVPNVYHKT